MTKEEEYLTKIKDICEVKNFIFHGYRDDIYKGNETRLVLECPKHGITWSTTRVSDFLRGNGCMQCGREATKKSLFKSEETLIASFFASNAFVEGTKFWRSERTTTKGVKAYWHYHCPICSNDDFVAAGLCSGVFEAYSGALQNGNKSCRCAANHIYTQEQQEYRISKLLKDKPDYKFTGWDGVYKGRGSRMLMTCSEHPDWATYYGDLSSGHGCPACNKKGGYDPNKPGHLYALKAESLDGRAFTGFGITNVPKRRMTEHRTNLYKDGFSITDSFLLEVEGHVAPTIERLLKQNFEKCSQSISGFVTEATLHEHYLDVKAFIEEHSRRIS